MAAPIPLPLVPQHGTGLVLLRGDEACLTVGLLLGLRAALPTRPLLIVDGANALDPYLLSDLARRIGQDPRSLLASVYISRVFTAYQLEAAVVDRLDGAIAARQPSGVLLSGLLDLLHDEDLPAAEARRVFRRLLAALMRLAAQPLPLIATCPTQAPVPGRGGFLPQMAAAAARVFAVEAHDGRVEITGEKPAAGRWWWEPEIALLAARRWY